MDINPMELQSLLTEPVQRDWRRMIGEDLDVDPRIVLVLSCREVALLERRSVIVRSSGGGSFFKRAAGNGGFEVRPGQATAGHNRLVLLRRSAASGQGNNKGEDNRGTPFCHK